MRVGTTASEVFKAFPNLRARVCKKLVGIYQPFLQTFVYCTPNVWARVEAARQKNLPASAFGDAFESLRKARILVPGNYCYEDMILAAGQRIQTTPQRIEVCYLLLTDSCNLRCTYCFILGNRTQSTPLARMSSGTIQKSVAFLRRVLRSSDGETPRVTFYGGEPLLNQAGLKLAVDLLREQSTVEAIGSAPILLLITNGTRVTREIAEFLQKNNVTASVSLDGDELEHDCARKDLHGQGTHGKAIRGFRILQETGVRTGISCTLGPHNSHRLAELADYFASELKPAAIGFNFTTSSPHGAQGCDIQSQSKAVIRAFTVLRRAGIHEERVMRRVQAVVEGRVRFYDCAGYGGQVVIAPNGDIGACHAYTGTREYFWGNVHADPVSPSEQVLAHWRSRTPFNMRECMYCPAITICGGGCAYQAQVATGSFWGLDKRYCTHCLELIDWMISDLLPSKLAGDAMALALN